MSGRRRLGLYGGSFDPIHRGHVDPVLRALQDFELDRVLYLPTAQPPHKEGPRAAPPLARYAMVELALLDHEQLHVSPFEMERQEVAYTVDTLEHFTALDTGCELVLLIGADSFLALERWVRWERIVELARIGILPRPGYDGTSGFDARLTPNLQRLLDSGRAQRVDDPTRVDLSSTEIRQRLAEGGGGLAEDLPTQVLHYIRKYDLYR